MATYARRCAYCNELFEAHSTKALYCSDRCYSLAYRSGITVNRLRTRNPSAFTVHAAVTQLRADREAFAALAESAPSEYRRQCARVRDVLDAALDLHEEQDHQREKDSRGWAEGPVDASKDAALIRRSLLARGLLHPYTFEPIANVLELNDIERKDLADVYGVDVDGLVRDAERKARG